MVQILAVDDDKAILALISNILGKEDYQVTTLQNPEKINTLDLNKFQLILLDIMMPGIDGYTICRNIRNMVDCPILFLTAKSMENDIVKGLALGADDYLIKPFGAKELRMRVYAHLRREKREKRHILNFEDIQFDLSGKQIYVKDEPISMTKGEYGICELLAMNRGQVFSREKIYEKVFGYDAQGDSNVIMEHIKNIRSKFQKEDQSPIETVWGIGYKWK